AAVAMKLGVLGRARHTAPRAVSCQLSVRSRYAPLIRGPLPTADGRPLPSWLRPECSDSIARPGRYCRWYALPTLLPPGAGDPIVKERQAPAVVQRDDEVVAAH